MAILDLIEFLDPTGEVLIAREPQDSSGALRYGSQLVVQDGQIAIFYKDGKALDRFGPGRYKLSTKNIPLLGTLIGLPFGGDSPFRSYVYFVALKTFTNVGWGTSTPVLFRDTDLRMVSLRANGVFSIRVGSPEVFLVKIVGTKGLETTFHIRDFLRKLIVSHLNQVLGKTMKSILDLPGQYGTIVQGVKEAIRADFEQYGIELIDLVINGITPPKEVQEMANRAAGIAAQDADKYRSIAASDALRDAARNPGIAGEGMGAGIGLGIGIGAARQLADSFSPSPSKHSSVATVEGPELSVDDVRRKLKEIKAMKEESLISDADYEEQKRRLLSQI